MKTISKTIKRDKRNIGKLVCRKSSNPSYNNRLGIVKGFRGDQAPSIPYVLFWDIRAKCLYPVPGDHLVLTNN